MTLPGNNQLKALIHKLVPDWPVESITDLDYLPGGYSNHNFRFRLDDAHYVLRAPGARINPAAVERERVFYQRYRADSAHQDVPHLVVLDADTGALISKWQDGPLLVEHSATPEQLVEYLNSLHQGLPDISHHYDPVAVALEYLSRGEPDPEILEMAQQLDWAPEDLRTCHNDLNPWNIICGSPQRWVTLDWEWYGGNDPLFDLVTLHQGLGWEDDLLTGMALDLLGAPVSAARLLSNLQAFWLREYAWAHAAMVDGSSRTEVVEQHQQARQKLRTLNS